jgi:hypothetical protein
MFFPAQGRRGGIGLGLSIPARFDGEFPGAGKPVPGCRGFSRASISASSAPIGSVYFAVSKFAWICGRILKKRDCYIESKSFMDFFDQSLRKRELCP